MGIVICTSTATVMVAENVHKEPKCLAHGRHSIRVKMQQEHEEKVVVGAISGYGGKSSACGV